ncbi:MAG: hypothetical protein IJP22_03260 [Clostridia bacterium]|nr:hypothetical protein [Clostridia bacterium]
MNFETVAQAAARLGVTVRAVQKWAKEGKLEGAQKMGRDWMVPFGAVVTEAKTEQTVRTDTKKVFDAAFPMFQLPYFSGDILEFINKIHDPDERNLYLIEYYYFIGELEKSEEIAELYVGSDNLNYRLSAELFSTFNSMITGHLHKVHFSAELLKREIEDSDLTDETCISENALKVFAGVVLKTQLHTPFETVPQIEEYIKYLPEGLRMISLYLSSYKAYLAKDYSRSLGIAQAAMNGATMQYPMPTIYCNIICAIDCVNLLQLDKAGEYIKKAWQLAIPHKIYMPFVEHYSILQGLLENNFKKLDPDNYNKIIEFTRSYNIAWYQVYNKKTDRTVSNELTPIEFTIAMLYSRNWRAKEIAAHMHISERTVSNYIQVIYEKLNINGRKELGKYLLT